MTARALFFGALMCPPVRQQPIPDLPIHVVPTVEIIREQDGTERTVDRLPVDTIMQTCRAGIAVDRFSLPADAHDVIRRMSVDQLHRLAVESLLEWLHAARLYSSSFTEQHIRLAQSMHDIRRAGLSIGIDVWPSLGPVDSTTK